MAATHFKISVAGSDEDWQEIKKIRHQVFMVEDNEPAEEQWDGNDFSSAIHLIIRSKGMAIGCMRLRIISMADGGTMIWERMAILQEYRGGLRLLNQLAAFALNITFLKGCRRVVGIVNNPKLIRFWERKGFRKTGEPAEVYRGKAYFPMHQSFEPPKPEKVLLPVALQSEAESLSAEAA